MNVTRQNKRSSTLRRVHLSTTTAIGLALAAGACGGRKTSPKYQIDDETCVVTVSAEDFGVAGGSFSRAGAATPLTEPAAGQFPAGLCIARVEAFLGESGDRRLRPQPLPEQHAIHWNHLLDDLPAVREIVFLRQPGLDPRGCRRDDILDAARANACDLCLIYARVEDSEADAEYVGVLCDTRSKTPIAAVRAPVVLPIEIAEELKQAPDCDVETGESDYRSEQEFRRLVRDLIWDLAKKDVSASELRESPWKDYVPPPLGPIYERHRYPQSDQPLPFNSPGRARRQRTQAAPDDPESKSPEAGPESKLAGDSREVE
ncbi:MAG TPA: hypothetical protein VNT79_18460 [Phycisphaerae bacterium]|nr:hypothetical protein [Phycisphaerae bacterium]